MPQQKTKEKVMSVNKSVTVNKGMPNITEKPARESPKSKSLKHE